MSEIAVKDFASPIIDTAIGEVQSAFANSQAYANAAWSAASLAIVELSTSKFDDLNIELPAIDSADLVNIDIDLLNKDVPQAPTLLSVNIPSLPVMGNLIELPDLSLLTTSLRNLTNAVLVKLVDMVEAGSTGLTEAEEQAIWDRALRRKESEDAKQYAEAEQFFSSRGYELPPGALAGRLQEVKIEIERRNDDLNNDILIESAKLAQSNFQYVMTSAIGQITSLLTKEIDAIIAENKSVIEVYIGQLDAFKISTQAQLAVVESQIKVFTAEVECYTASINAGSTVVEAQVKTNLAMLEQTRVQLEMNIKQAELQLEIAKSTLTLQVEALRSVAQVSGQVAASALSCVNASANVGASGSGNVSFTGSEQVQWDATKTTEPGLQRIQHLSASSST